MYNTMERYSGAAHHIYILDFNRDGYLDIVLPNLVSNELVMLSNPGLAYWHRMDTIAGQQNKQRQWSDLKQLQRWD